MPSVSIREQSLPWSGRSRRPGRITFIRGRYQTASPAVITCPITVATSAPHHAPAADEDEDGIQKDIHHRSGQRGYHGEAGSAAGPDDGVHGLTEHIEGDAQRDVEEILLRIAEGLGIDGAAEHGQDLIGKQQVQRRQHQTAPAASTTALPTARRASSRWPCPARY